MFFQQVVTFVLNVWFLFCIFAFFFLAVAHHALFFFSPICQILMNHKSKPWLVRRPRKASALFVVAVWVFTKIFCCAALHPLCPGLCRPSAWRNYEQQAWEQKVTSQKGSLCLHTLQFHTLVEKGAQRGFLLRQHPGSKLGDVCSPEALLNEDRSFCPCFSFAQDDHDTTNMCWFW